MCFYKGLELKYIENPDVGLKERVVGEKSGYSCTYMCVLVNKLNLKVYGVLQEWKDIWVCNGELVTDEKFDDLILSRLID